MLPVIPGFELTELLGRGASCVVWKGFHLSAGVPVAVKVLAGNPSRAARLRFEDEVRACAMVDHPHVVRIHDYGAMEDGRPWLAMEWVRGGSLADQPAPTWPRLRGWILDLLAGLAHVHARGLVHRDIKPANVLLDASGRAKVADLGLAATRAWLLGDAGICGTPAYMAPEQWAGRSDRIGPWTDLFAVGRILEGFAGRPAPLRPVLEALLAMAHSARCPTAARAAAALQALPDDLALAPSEPQDANGGTWFEDPAWGELSASEEEPSPATEGVGHAGCEHGLPPPPRAATRPAEPPPRRALTGTGIALLGLREPPLTGREPILDALWAAVGEVAAETPAAVALVGPRGVGLSRLGRWLAQAVETHGAARAVVIPADEQVCAGLLRALGADGLAAPERGGRRTPLGRSVADGDLPGALDLALAWAHDLPLVLVLDRDDAEARRLAELALARQAAILVVTIGWAPPSQRARALPVPPMEVEALLHVVAAALRLEEGAARYVVDLAEGRPGRAIGLLRHWLSTGVLAPGPSGVVGWTRGPVEAPSDTHRAGALLDAALGAPPSVALAVAAGLGPMVELGSWSAACAVLGLEVPFEALDRLLRAGLAEGAPCASGDAWAIVDPDVVEHLRGALDGTALRAIAVALEASRAPGRAVALAWWRAASRTGDAGDRARSADVVGAYLLTDRQVEPGDVLWWCDRLAEVLDPPEDPRHVHLLLKRYGAFLALSRLDEAREDLARAVEVAQRHGHTELEARALVLRAQLAARSRAEGSAEIAEIALRAARAVGTAELVGRAHEALGLLALFDGRLDDARAAFLEAVATPVQRWHATSLRALAWMAEGDQDVEGRLHWLGRARDLGAPEVACLVQNDLASAHREAGDLQSARAALDDGIALGRRHALPEVGTLLVMRAWLHTMLGDTEALARDLDESTTWPVDPSVAPMGAACRGWLASATGDAEAGARARAELDAFPEDAPGLARARDLLRGAPVGPSRGTGGA